LWLLHIINHRGPRSIDAFKRDEHGQNRRDNNSGKPPATVLDAPVGTAANACLARQYWRRRRTKFNCHPSPSARVSPAQVIDLVSGAPTYLMRLSVVQVGGEPCRNKGTSAGYC